jgi:hypothetical protein
MHVQLLKLMELYGLGVLALMAGSVKTIRHTDLPLFKLVL